MPTIEIFILSLVGLVVAVFGTGFGVVAAADPEGRGSNIATACFVAALIGIAAFLGLAIVALVRWLH